MKDQAGLLCALVALLAPLAAHAAPHETASPFGYATSRAPGKVCQETLALDQAAFIQSVPALKALGVINADYVTQTVVNTRPFTLSMAYLMNSAPDSVSAAFGNDPTLQQCFFRATIKFQDDYGNDKSETAFSFEIPRALYIKVNWAKIDAKRFQKIAPHFVLSPSIVAEMQAERADQ
jgi:hypothetical protein